MRELAAFNVKHTRTTDSAAVPAVGSDVEVQLLTALEQGIEDASRVDPTAVWRPYSRLIQGTADGGPLTNGEKLQLAMRVHLPRDQPVAVEEFLKRLRGFFKEKWDVEVPEMVFNTTATNGVKEEEQKQQQQQPTAEVAAAAAEAAPSPPGQVKAEQRDPNNNNEGQEQQKPVAEGVPTAADADEAAATMP
jgi:hypothetical protein